MVLGEFSKVEQLLGRPYSFCGRVAHGEKLGRQLGFPTANINLKRVSSPLSGVYAVSLLLKSENKLFSGVANVGCKPTVGHFKSSLEVHLFDFNKDIYGEYVEVQFHQKLRDEQRFTGIEQLKEQISKDSQTARDFFASKESQ